MDYSEYSETRTIEGVIKNGLFRDTCNITLCTRPREKKNKTQKTEMMSNADPTKKPGMNSNAHQKVRSYGFLQYSYRDRGKEQSTQKEKNPLAFEK